jgi:hypothetical protein
MYCEEERPALVKQAEEAEAEDGDKKINVDEELERGWKDLSGERRDEFDSRYEQALAKYQKEKDAWEAAKAKPKAKRRSAAPVAEDDEPEDDDDEDAEADTTAAVKGEADADAGAEDTPMAGADDDVEMGNSDTDQDTQA